MRLDRKTVLALVAGFAACWFVSNGCTLQPEKPLANRPVLRWIAKAAKSLLWVAVFVEPAPAAETAEHGRTMHHEHDEVGADGHPLVHNARGW